METYYRLRTMVNNLEKDMKKYYSKDNNSAFIRARKELQLIKEVAKEIRMEMSRRKRGI
jgi:hypothetical protein